MNEPVSTELSASARQLIADARGADDPTAEDEARVKARWLAGIAAGAGMSSLSEVVRAAATTGWGLKAGALAAALAAATAGLYLGWPQPAGPDRPVPPLAPPVMPAAPAAAPVEPALLSAPAAEAVVPRAPEAAPAPRAEAAVDEAAPESAPDTPSAPEAAPPVRAPAAWSTPPPQRPRVAARAVTDRKAPVAAPVEAAAPLAPSVATPAASGQLGEELSLISQIRGQLQAGSASTALEQLAAYRRRFGHPHLAMEADALRVDALCQSGDRDGARAAAATFAATWPASPLQQRVSAACP